MDEARTGLSLRFLGPFAVTVNRETLPPLRTFKGRWLLALLALKDGKPVERDYLATTLWPDSPDSQALYNLRRCLSDLRGALGAEAERIASPSAHTVRLDLDGADFDVAAFDAAVRPNASPADLERAVTLYRGSLMEGCEEPWVVPERAVREEAYLGALARLAEVMVSRGERRAAIRYWERLLQTDPLREEALRALMQTLADIGDGADALDTYRTHRLRLRDAYSTDLSPETRALHAALAVRQQAIVSAPSPVATFDPSPVSGLPTPGGALPLDSPLYIERAADPAFVSAVARGDSIVLVKGARQIGKTSLLARGLAHARSLGCRVAIADLQKLTQEQLTSAGTLLSALAEQLCHQLGLEATPEPAFGWRPGVSPNENFERFVRRHTLKAEEGRLVWALDEVDRLFGRDYSSDIFALFRAWHNERALDPDGPWSRLTLAMAYATEAHLFVTDLNQSPFNVGTRVTLADFSPEEFAELNGRWGSPIPDTAHAGLYALVGGHPFLTQTALHALAGGTADFTSLEASARSPDGGPFGDHLRRLRFLLEQDPALREGVRVVLTGAAASLDSDKFYRLRAAGVLSGDAPANARFRCRLYEIYLAAFL